MKEEPLVSIIVPVYNVEQYLERCLESIINQTYENIEIILVDDGSPDNCGKICDNYAQKDSRIVVLHQENGGVSFARNNALDIAKGDFLTFVDSDDFIQSNYVQDMCDLLSKYNCDIVQCDFESGNASDFSVKKPKDSVKIIEGDKWANGYTYKTIAWCKLYKKELFDNIRFPVGKIHEDEAVYYKLAYKSKRICLTDKKLYYYYMSSNSIMRNNRINLDFIDIYEERLRFFSEKNEEYLVGKSYERYAIVLLLHYAGLLKKEADSKTLNIVIKKHKEIFYKSLKYVRGSNIILIVMFRLAPNLTAKALNLFRR